MTVIKVPDMHCEKCVERIQNLLQEEGLSFQVSLEQKTVTIDGCETCVKTALEALDDLGFTPEIRLGGRWREMTGARRSIRRHERRERRSGQRW